MGQGAIGAEGHELFQQLRSWLPMGLLWWLLTSSMGGVYILLNVLESAINKSLAETWNWAKIRPYVIGKLQWIIAICGIGDKGSAVNWPSSWLVLKSFFPNLLERFLCQLDFFLNPLQMWLWLRKLFFFQLVVMNLFKKNFCVCLFCLTLFFRSEHLKRFNLSGMILKFSIMERLTLTFIFWSVLRLRSH